jgi:hypothetical protein
MQVAPIQNPNPIPEAVPCVANVQNPPPVDNHEIHNNEAPAEADDQPANDNNGVQAPPPKVVDVDDDANDQPIACNLCSCTHVTSVLKMKPKQMMAKTSTTSTIPSSTMRLLKGRRSKDEDGDTLMDTP